MYDVLLFFFFVVKKAMDVMLEKNRLGAPLSQ